MREPLISIIIPVYNAEEFLEGCLDSIVNQTYKNVEILCVNDGSTDGTLEILQEYAQNDDRVKIFNKSNEGASKARNYALEHANGEYIMFVDSDDWIDEETCEIAVDAIINKDVDLVMWSYIREGKVSSLEKRIYDCDVLFDANEVKTKLYRRMFGLIDEELRNPENADALCTIWGKLYKNEIIRKQNIEFYDIRKIGTFEDGIFNIDYLKHSNNAVFLNRPLYHYRKNQNSVTRSYNPNLQAKHEHIHRYLQDYIEKNNLNDKYETALSNRIAFELIGYGGNILNKSNENNKYKQIKQIISNPVYANAYRKLKMEYLPIHWRVFFWCAKYKFTAVVLVLLIIIKRLVSWR